MTYKSLRSEWCWLAWEVTDPRRSPKIDAYMRPFGTACTCLHASCSRVLTGATEQRTQRVWGGERARQSASALPSHPATCMTSTPDSDKHLTQGTGDKAWGRKGIWVTRGFSFSPCHAEFPQPFPMNTESSSSRRRKIRSSSNYSSRAVRRECSLGKKDAYPRKLYWAAGICQRQSSCDLLEAGKDILSRQWLFKAQCSHSMVVWLWASHVWKPQFPHP